MGVWLSEALGSIGNTEKNKKKPKDNAVCGVVQV